MNDLLWLPVALGIVFVINIVPVFMPSTWAILAFFYIKFDIPLLLLTIPGAIVSGCGRYVLYRATDWSRDRFLNKKEGDLQTLGNFLNQHRKALSLTVFLY